MIKRLTKSSLLKLFTAV